MASSCWGWKEEGEGLAFCLPQKSCSSSLLQAAAVTSLTVRSLHQGTKSLQKGIADFRRSLEKLLLDLTQTAQFIRVEKVCVELLVPFSCFMGGSELLGMLHQPPDET